MKVFNRNKKKKSFFISNKKFNVTQLLPIVLKRYKNININAKNTKRKKVRKTERVSARLWVYVCVCVFKRERDLVNGGSANTSYQFCSVGRSRSNYWKSSKVSSLFNILVLFEFMKKILYRCLRWEKKMYVIVCRSLDCNRCYFLKKNLKLVKACV